MANILWEDHGAVRLITINRPDQMNSLDFVANEELVDVWRAFAADQSVRVAVITGAGEKAFCAGADLKTYTMSFAQRPGYEFRVQFTDGPGFGGITRGLEVSKPTIAAVNGFAISGGLELVLACDLRFCSTNAEFALQDVRWGFHACDGGLVRLPQIVGLGNAMEIVLSGERITSQHALRIGLVNAIHPESGCAEDQQFEIVQLPQALQHGRKRPQSSLSRVRHSRCAAARPRSWLTPKSEKWISH